MAIILFWTKYEQSKILDFDILINKLLSELGLWKISRLNSG